jgi:hypothetical protein
MEFGVKLAARRRFLLCIPLFSLQQAAHKRIAQFIPRNGYEWRHEHGVNLEQ